MLHSGILEPMSSSTPDSGSAVLEALGLTDRERALFAPMAEEGLELARVARVDRGLPLVATESGIERAELASRLIKSENAVERRAVVGDWVALARPEGHEMPVIEAVLPRKSAFARKDPGDQAEPQVVVANADVVFVIQSLSGGGVNVGRLERELVLAWESGAVPVVVLSKADLAENPEAQRALAAEIAHGVDVIVESAVTGEGLAELAEHVPPGTTAVLLGGSGVGKSTLLNRLVGEEVQATAAVRESDDKGRHTTIAREIVQVPGGGVVIDTPGMRAIGLWDAEEGIEAAFPDVERLAAECRFRDCRHEREPGCAVVDAVDRGELPARRLESYRRLRAELDALARQQDEQAWRTKDATNKSISKAIKRFYSTEPKGKGRR